MMICSAFLQTLISLNVGKKINGVRNTSSRDSMTSGIDLFVMYITTLALTFTCVESMVTLPNNAEVIHCEIV